MGQICHEGEDQRGPSPSALLHEILDDLGTLRDLIVGGVQSMDSEARRAANTTAVWEAAVKTEGTDLAAEIAKQLKRVRQADVITDDSLRTLLGTLKSFVERVPAFSSALTEGEGLTIRNLAHIVETHNPALEEQEQRASVQRFQTLLEQLAEALALLMGRLAAEKTKVDDMRDAAEAAREALNAAVDDNLATISSLPPPEDESKKPGYDNSEIMATLQQMLATGRGFGGGDSTTDAALRAAMLDPEIPLDQRHNLEAQLLEKQFQQESEAQVANLAEMLDQEGQQQRMEEEQRSNARVEQVQQVLDEKPITAQEKEQILESLEQDKRALEEALEIERLKQEEQIKAVLQVRCFYMYDCRYMGNSDF